MKNRTSIGVAAFAATALAATLASLPAAAQQSGDGKWEGFYAGLNTGGLWASTAASIAGNNTFGGFNGNGAGWVGGAQVGYNYMVGQVLLGGEVDFQGSTQAQGLSGGAGPSMIGATSALPWFSSADWGYLPSAATGFLLLAVVAAVTERGPERIRPGAAGPTMKVAVGPSVEVPQ